MESMNSDLCLAAVIIIIFILLRYAVKRFAAFMLGGEKERNLKDDTDNLQN